MKNIIYLIPLDGFGGVEVAANSLKGLNHKSFKFSTEFIFKKRSEIYNFYKLVKSIKNITIVNPDILIVSLWRSCFVGIFVKIFRPKINIILFIHSEKDVHFFDFLLTRIALLFAHEVWCDSILSVNNRFNFLINMLNIKVISFNSRKINSIENINISPNFIYWGRVSDEKGIYRAIKIFKGILHYYPNAVYKVIGFCDLDFHKLKQYCIDNGVINSIEFYDEMDFEDIKIHAMSSSFYLQTSKYEGLAMSVMESMMLGLVPVVTPVGEIANYCNNKNSILVYSDIEVVRDILIVLESKDIFYKLSSSAIETWAGKISYKDSVIRNCERLTSRNV